MSFIEIKELVYKYDKKSEAMPLSGVSLSIEEGEFVSILGPNGSGKSTLVRCINGIIKPTSGIVKVDGMFTSDSNNVDNIRRVVGMVFQNPDNQIVSSVVEEDVAFGPENLNIENPELSERVDSALKFVKLDALRKRDPYTLSGGQKQRLAIAGIIAMRPKCIILDEPTNMLDPQGRLEVMEVVHELNKSGITVILVTHIMEETINSDKIFILDAGKLVMQGTPQEVFSNVELVESHCLHVPESAYIAHLLKQKGIELEGPILSPEDLVSSLMSIIST